MRRVDKILQEEDPARQAPDFDIDVLNEAGATPLIVAVQHGSLEAVRELIDLGASLTLRNAQGHTALHAAVAKQLPRLDGGINTAATQSLLAELLDVYELKHSPDEGHIWEGETPLHIAASLGLAGHVRVIIESKAYKQLDPADLRDNHGLTPLEVACTNGHLDVVDILYTEEGSRVYYKGLIIQAVQQGRLGLLRRLLSYERPSQGASNMDAEASDLKEAKAQLLTDVNRDDGGLTGWHALHWAAQAERNGLGMVEALLPFVWDVDVRGSVWEVTALHLACVHGKSDVAERLLKAGANPMKIAGKGLLSAWGSSELVATRAIHLAARHGHKSVLQLLVEAGVPATLRDVDYRQPLHIA
eukprot:scaffold77258_cov18-Prasinocladus_malaysianus.AAC.2